MLCPSDDSLTPQPTYTHKFPPILLLHPPNCQIFLPIGSAKSLYPPFSQNVKLFLIMSSFVGELYSSKSPSTPAFCLVCGEKDNSAVLLLLTVSLQGGPKVHKFCELVSFSLQVMLNILDRMVNGQWSCTLILTAVKVFF